MADKTVVVREGTSVLGLLGVAFVVLKLCGVIDWSWFWVTLPFWCGIGLILFVLVLVAGCFSALGLAYLVVAVATWVHGKVATKS